jgi:hypothetical protein
MDQTTRNHLQRATQDARRLLEAELSAQLEGTFDILPDGRILPEPGSHLDDRQRLVRGEIVQAIEHTRAKEAGKTAAQAIDDFRREAAFTFLNRFAALKMLEARGLVQQCISKGDQSAGFREFGGLAPGLADLPDKGYRLYLECLFDELAAEIKVLFDRRDPAALLWPRRQALTELLDVLNRAEIAGVWGEDEAIGWVYQYFNSQEERRAMREASQAPRNSRELAVRNQFFTPRYVVEFLTDNTLGRIWYEMRQGRTTLKEQCRFLVRRPDEVFLAESTASEEAHAQGCVRMAQQLTTAAEADFPPFSAEEDHIQRVIDLAHCVDAYEQFNPPEKIREGEPPREPPRFREGEPPCEPPRFREGEPPCEPVRDEARTEPRPPRTTKRHSGDSLFEWFASAKTAIESGQFEGRTTGELLNYLFCTCRQDRMVGFGEVYREPWFVVAANEVRQRFLSGRAGGISQEQLLKAPVAIPYRRKKDPRDIKVLDPACGSGHFLLYCFDLLIAIYQEAWKDERSPKSEVNRRSLREDYSSLEALRVEIPGLILRHNLHGIDIDPRCAQIAALALWMRAQRAFNDFGISRDQRPAIRKTNVVVAEPMPGERDMLDGFLRSLREDRLESLMRKALNIPDDQRVRATQEMAESLCQLVEAVWEKMRLAGEAGSLLKIQEELASAVATGRDEWEEKLPLFRVTEYSTGGRGSEMYYRHLPEGGQDFWRQAEVLTVCAIEEYGANSQGGEHFARRMFADDATRGFAFIDLCRKRYDVVLMNPPFGDRSAGADDYLQEGYPDTASDFLSMFYNRALGIATANGKVGAITNRTWLGLPTFERLRTEVFGRLGCVDAAVDLGSFVLDAQVETAAAVIGRDRATSQPGIWIRVLKTKLKERTVLQATEMAARGERHKTLFHASHQRFESLPSKVCGYWMSDSIIKSYRPENSIGAKAAEIKQGTATADDFRFLRLAWEIAPRTIGVGNQWVWFAKGGEFSPFFDDIHLTLMWKNDGQEIIAWGSGRPQNAQYFGNPGVTWPRRTTSQFGPRAFPGGCAFGDKGPVAFPRQRVRPEVLLGILASRPSKLLLSVRLGAGDDAPGSASKSYEVGLVKDLPFPDIDESTGRELGSLAAACIALVQRTAVESDETATAYVAPLVHRMASGLREAAAIDVARRERRFAELMGLTDRLDELVSDLLGFGEAERNIVWEELELPVTRLRPESEVDDEVFKRSYLTKAAIPGELLPGGLEADFDVRVQTRRKKQVELRDPESICRLFAICPQTFVSRRKDLRLLREEDVRECVESWSVYSLGCAFGRWDIRFARGQESAPGLPDPFAPLRVCPPGALQDGEGLPLTKEHVARLQDTGQWNYPLDIPWAGILVNDPGHPLDIEARVQRVLEAIWIDRWEAIEREACEILGVATLRDYFRKPTAFFDDHLKRYSKSRRQAPIYWPLSSSGGNYTTWLYYHRFRRDTLFQALNDFAKPKLQHEQQNLDRLRSGAGSQPTRSQREAVETQESLVSDLEGFVEELGRVAPLWNPDPNDGVIINFAPLWRMIGHTSWRKSVKECWDTLCAGDYDWSHLAMHLWPERVVPKCADDASLAIAHGLDEVFWEKDDRDRWVKQTPPKGGWKPVIDRLVAERASEAVKSALQSLLSAPSPSGRTGRRRRGGARA